MEKKFYWEGRPETEIERRYGPYKMKIRFWANCDKAQVTMYDLGALRFPLIWSEPLNDKQAHAALSLFEAIGYFDIANTTLTT